ncbi:hypothetical protein EJ04DRAFT_549654 [Polyplosphaeria fusca]|uniref:DUF3074 domain-containing protein n=1 Tax=Polyplosphaeria fusca TaxID=682080 RepID=A0A9P4R8P2_9PLEO|nr:hypothetical protein EJ04DRAFT_549654 [Polyplosphaeria fusca]
MSELHKALESLRPKDFGDVPVDALGTFISELCTKAELIANSVPPPPNGTPYESAQRTRIEASGATSAADLTISRVRRPATAAHHSELQKSWGKPLKLSAKDAATGISVFKMAGHDRHGAWFARTSVHEGLGFAKWKAAMIREFPESLAVQGGPGEGNIRGIGGDQRLEEIDVTGVGKLQVYQLSAQFPGPTSPREFITLLITSDNSLTDDSKVGNAIPRHFMVISIPVTHPEAPPRDGLVRGYYESIELIREIPLKAHDNPSTSTPDLLSHEHQKGRDRGNTIGFAESRGTNAKGEKIDRVENPNEHDPETNPVEWIMITRSDPGGGIPRFMVERSTPSSIVQDAEKFLNWACSTESFPTHDEAMAIAEDAVRKSFDQRSFSISASNGILAGVGTSIVDKPMTGSHRRVSRAETDGEERAGVLQSVASAIDGYIPDSMNPLQRTDSHSSSTTESSVDSFASAEQFNTAPDGLPIDDMPTPSTASEKTMPLSPSDSGGATQNSAMNRELQRIEQKRLQLREKLDQAREKQSKETQDTSLRSAKELEKATEKHNRERKKQEDRFTKEVQKLEARRERETKKLLERQRKEADKNILLKAQRERSEWKERAELAEKENNLLKEQIGELQRENTALVANMGRTDSGREILKKVREEVEGKAARDRASSRASAGSKGSRRSATFKSEKSDHQRSHSHSQLSQEEAG